GRTHRMALKGVSGALASYDLLEAVASRNAGAGSLRSVLREAREALGPASGARQIVDVLVIPLLAALGVIAAVERDDGESVALSVAVRGRAAASLSAGGWNYDLRRLRRGAATHRWWIGTNGATLRVMDVTRAYTQRALDFDLERIEEDDRALAVLAGILSSGAEPPFAALEELVSGSE